MKILYLLPIAVIPFLVRLLRFILEPDYIRPRQTLQPQPHRCDGDLIVSEIRGHRVELFRWLK